MTTVDNNNMFKTWFSSVSLESGMYKHSSPAEHSNKKNQGQSGQELYFTRLQTIRHSTPVASRNNGYTATRKLNFKYLRTSEQLILSAGQGKTYSCVRSYQ